MPGPEEFFNGGGESGAGSNDDVCDFTFLSSGAGSVLTAEIIFNGAGPGACGPPAAGDWIVTQDCTLTQDATAPANVIVEAGVSLTIAANVTLNIDFVSFHVLVKDTGKLVIKSGAKVD